LGRLPEIAEEHDSAMSVIAAAEAGHGVALVASCFSCIAGPRLKIREIMPNPRPITVGIAYHRQHLSPAAERFLKCVTNLSAAPIQRARARVRS
jgi:DNA-binding transcriptional LysR family regulator